MMLGRVDEVDGHFIATRFVALAVPMECLYITHLKPRSSRPDGVRIQTEWRSIALGYGRLWLPIVAIALPIAEAALDHLHVATMVATVVMLALSGSAHLAGRLSEKEKARLRLLGTVTTLRIDPSKLETHMRANKHASLGELMGKGGIPMSPPELLAVLDDIPLPALPLVYAYARYAGDAPEWRECAEAVYERHTLAEF